MRLEVENLKKLNEEEKEKLKKEKLKGYTDILKNSVKPEQNEPI